MWGGRGYNNNVGRRAEGEGVITMWGGGQREGM